MANSKISALTALVGASVESADVMPIVDTSTTTTKKITFEELRIGLGIATQAQQETATSLITTVTPGRQHFHPSAVKAWGTVTAPTTITESYPSGGVSVTNPATGQYTVTHGLTFSTSTPAILVTANSTANGIMRIEAKTATTFTVQHTDTAGNAIAPTSGFNYLILGDL